MCVTPPGALLASRLVLGAILIVLFVIDLEHQILPNVITLPGIVVGFLFSLVAPPGPDRLARWASRSARACSMALPRLLPACAGKKAWAWAT